jgi:hypothetical protein
VPGVMFGSDMVTKQNPPMALESGFRFHTAVILAMLPSVLMAHTGDHSEQTVSQGVVHMLLSWDHLLVCMLGGGLLGSSIGWSLGRIMAGSAITGLGLLGYQQWASGNTAWLMPALLLSILLVSAALCMLRAQKLASIQLKGFALARATMGLLLVAASMQLI